MLVCIDQPKLVIPGTDFMCCRLQSRACCLGRWAHLNLRPNDAVECMPVRMHQLADWCHIFMRRFSHDAIVS
jgi:hypothetical protein